MRTMWSNHYAQAFRELPRQIRNEDTMSAARCNLCGRYRRWADVIGFDAGDEYPEETIECKTCTAPSNHTPETETP